MRNHLRPTITVVAVLATLAACGSTSKATEPVATTASASAPTTASSAAPTSAAAATTIPATVASTESSAPPVVGPDWRDEIKALCDAASKGLSSIPVSDGTAAGITAEVDATTALLDKATPFTSVVVPSDVTPVLDKVVTLGTEARAFYKTAGDAAAAGDVVTGQHALDQGFDRILRVAQTWVLAGAACGADPARVTNAQLTVPLEMDPSQIGAGFGSIWVSEQSAGRVVRLDPATGTIQATIDVGDTPRKLQPADGSMWVRTAAAYVRIDPSTNTVSGTLAKADVGPAANRSWAVDGAQWICDGRRVHRYDPTTLTLTATVDINVDCGQVYATSQLVVAWNYNEDAGESGTSAAAFIDPATNTVLSTVALPVDVSGPTVLADSVFLGGLGGSKAVVDDRATWTVTSTPDLGRPLGGSQLAFDGHSIYVCSFDGQELLQVDSSTFAVTKTIEPLGAASVVVDDHTLWVNSGGPIEVVQRFTLG